VCLVGEFTLEQAHLLPLGAQLFGEHGTERNGPSPGLCRAHCRERYLPAVLPRSPRPGPHCWDSAERGRAVPWRVFRSTSPRAGSRERARSERPNDPAG
jgi:hypothetical protein